jgi:hypothetical protein
VSCVQGNGRSPAGLTPELIKERGLKDALPEYSGLSVVVSWSVWGLVVRATYTQPWFCRKRTLGWHWNLPQGMLSFVNSTGAGNRFRLSLYRGHPMIMFDILRSRPLLKELVVFNAPSPEQPASLASSKVVCFTHRQTDQIRLRMSLKLAGCSGEPVVGGEKYPFFEYLFTAIFAVDLYQSSGDPQLTLNNQLSPKFLTFNYLPFHLRCVKRLRSRLGERLPYTEDPMNPSNCCPEIQHPRPRSEFVVPIPLSSRR